MKQKKNRNLQHRNSAIRSMTYLLAITIVNDLKEEKSP